MSLLRTTHRAGWLPGRSLPPGRVTCSFPALSHFILAGGDGVGLCCNLSFQMQKWRLQWTRTERRRVPGAVLGAGASVGMKQTGQTCPRSWSWEPWCQVAKPWDSRTPARSPVRSLISAKPRISNKTNMAHEARSRPAKRVRIRTHAVSRLTRCSERDSEGRRGDMDGVC